MVLVLCTPFTHCIDWLDKDPVLDKLTTVSLALSGQAGDSPSPWQSGLVWNRPFSPGDPVDYPSLTFVLDTEARNAAPFTSHLVACRVAFHLVGEQVCMNLDGLVTLLTSQCPLSLISFNFADYEQLQSWMKSYPLAMTNLLDNTNAICTLICGKSEPYSMPDSAFPEIPRANGSAGWIRIDPLTLEPIGIICFPHIT